VRVRVTYNPKWHYAIEYRHWWFLPWVWINAGPCYSKKEDAIDAARKMLEVTEVTK